MVVGLGRAEGGGGGFVLFAGFRVCCGVGLLGKGGKGRDGMG